MQLQGFHSFVQLRQFSPMIWRSFFVKKKLSEVVAQIADSARQVENLWNVLGAFWTSSRRGNSPFKVVGWILGISSPKKCPKHSCLGIFNQLPIRMMSICWEKFVNLRPISCCKELKRCNFFVWGMAINLRLVEGRLLPNFTGKNIHLPWNI